MPLLKRKPFSPEKPPADLKPDEEVFVCRHTNEVFRNYESFFKRTILCNSLVWTCKLTGKSGLTYAEAQKSENKVEKQGRTLPEPIQQAALTLVHHTQRGRLANLCDEVYSYIKDRYQEGEEVDVLCSGRRRQGVIVDVIPPEDNSVRLVNAMRSPKERKHSSTKSAEDLSSPTSKKSSGSGKTPTKSRTHSTDDKPKTPKSRKSSISDTRDKVTPSKKHRLSTSEDGKSQTTFRSKKHSMQDRSPGHSSNHNGKDVASTSKMHKEGKDDRSPTSDDRPVFFSDEEALCSPKLNKSNSAPDVVVIKDDHSSQEDSSSSQTLASPKNKMKCLWPAAQQYKYEVKLRPEKGGKKKDKAEVVIVSAYQVSRIKGVFTREKLKVFLKISCIRSTPQSDDGFYVVKREYCEKFDLGEPVAVQLSATPKQKKERAKKRKSSQGHAEGGSAKKKKRALTGDNAGSESKKQKKKEKEREAKLKKMTAEERQKFLEEEKEKKKKILEEEKERRRVEKEREKNEMKAKREEERVKKKVERDRERERLKEQKRIEAIVLREYNKPREDLHLDDLKELPSPVPLNLKIPQDLFGDVVMVLEFLNIFGSIFDMKDEFPSGLSFAMLEEALTEHDAEGVYYDLMQFLLGAILRTHLEEEEDEGLDRMHVKNPEKMDLDEDETDSTATVSAAASIAAAWPLVYQGKALHELIMDPFTCSELLRLHLMSSGARIGCRDASYRWQRRGGFTYSDDAVVEFRHREPGILKALVTNNVYDLSAPDKLKILVALCTQMMTYAIARDHMEDGFERYKKARREWQEDQWADVRREKEEAAARYRQKQAERLRQKERMERKKKEKEKGGTSSNPESQTSGEPSQEEDKKKSDEKNSKKRNKGKAKEDEKAPSQESNDATTAKQEEKEELPQKSSDEIKEDLTRIKEEEEELARQRKEERRRKDNEFILELSKATAMSSLQSLGRDRMFRRYWSFKALRGLYVEEDDPELQTFLQESDEEEGSEDDEAEEVDSTENTQASASTSKASENGANAVNSVENSKPQSDVKENGDMAPVVNGRKSETEAKEAERSDATTGSDKTSAKEDSIAKNLREIYKDRQIVRWSLLKSKEQLDSLLGSLNQRGMRERVLRENIQQDYKNLVKSIEKCPFTEENQGQKKESKQKGRRGGRQPQQGVDKSRYKAMEEFIEANLRDQVLDLEDRVWQGGLGILKVEDRPAWRKKIENGIYDHFGGKGADAEALQNDKDGDGQDDKDGDGQDDKDGDGVLVNGDAGAGPMEEGLREEQQVGMETELAVHSSEEDKPDQPVVNGDVEKMDVDESNTVCEELEKLPERPSDLPLSSVPAHLHPVKSETSSPVSESRSGTPTISLATSFKAVNPVIKELAVALLKVEQGIERKYLNPPLGEDEETKKQKQREAAATALKEFNEMMKRAEEGKKKAKKEKRDGTNSQTDGRENKDENENGQQKDNDDASSSSSEEPTKAKTCLERWEESLMACTNLSQVFVHLNTLDQSIAWSKSVLNARCRLCRRKGDAEHMLLCDACDRGHHMYCLKPPIKEIPEGNWFCADCRPKEPRRSDRRRKPVISEDEEEDQEDEVEEAEEGNSGGEEDSDYDSEDGEEEEESEEEESDCAASEHGDACALCGEAGELLCCDTCPLAYHLTCAYPPLRRVPRGNWACQVCTGADEDRSRKERVKKVIIEAAQKSLRKSAKAAAGRSSRAASRSSSRQGKSGSRSSRKRRVSPSPSPPPRGRRGQRRSSADSGTKSKRRRSVRVESGR